MTDYQRKIYEILEDIDPVLIRLCQPMLENDDRLEYWPAAVAKHHAYWGGLMKHTYQVLRFALDSVAHVPNADRLVIAVAAVWHDYGKLWDYIIGYIDRYKKELGDVSYTQMANYVGHLSLSAMHFINHFKEERLATNMMLVTKDGKRLGPDWALKVHHAIIAHHGRKEWGSPREPQTLEALAVHHADMMSVMLDTNENPQLRSGSDKKPKMEYFKAEDLTEGDLVVFRNLNSKGSDKKTGTFVRLDKNSCPVVRLAGNLTKVPLRTIQQIIPPQDAIAEDSNTDTTAERKDTGLEPDTEDSSVVGSDPGGTASLPDQTIREELPGEDDGVAGGSGEKKDEPSGAESPGDPGA